MTQPSDRLDPRNLPPLPKGRGAKGALTRGDLIVGALVAVALLGFVFYGISTMSKQASGNWLTGEIVARRFEPRNERQITIGSDGVRSGDLAGEFTFTVRVPATGREYTVWVDQQTYESRKEGDSFRFPKPVQPPEP